MHDPRLALLRRVLEGRRVLRIERTPTHQEAAVTLLLRPQESVEILLIKRAERETDPWSGHMALPGGRRSVNDADLLATALRETEEEIGIPVPEIGELIGPLDDVAPATPRLPPIVISPYIVAVPADAHVVRDPREVDDAVWVPVPALREEGAVSEILIQLTDGERAFPSLRFGEYVIWGLTHRILSQFLELAAEAGI